MESAIELPDAQVPARTERYVRAGMTQQVVIRITKAVTVNVFL